MATRKKLPAQPCFSLGMDGENYTFDLAQRTECCKCLVVLRGNFPAESEACECRCHDVVRIMRRFVA